MARSVEAWRLGFLLAMALGLAGFLPAKSRAADEPPPAVGLELRLRTRVETSPGSGRFHTVVRPETWEPARTAIVVCDMWNQHWCQGATRRVAEMAPRMNQVLAAARRQGVLIIHCPSDTLKYYRDTPARKLAQQAPRAEGRTPIRNWCALDGQREGALPIDDSDGGCDCQPQCRQGSPWTHQIDTLEILPGDALTDSAEAYSLMRQRGIDQVIVMGVHTNMCVLGRPCALRPMVRLGQRVVLMRDLTDTMYNSRQRPYVSHFTGTDLVVEHIEKHWCPTITSVDFLGGEPHHFSEDHRRRLAIVMAEDEYETEKTLPALALAHLGRDFQIGLIFGDDQSQTSIPGLEALDEADLALISVRRRLLPESQLAPLRRLVAAGKPMVGIRTANHAFAARDGQEIPAGLVAWNEFDAQVWGGNYHGHHGNKSDPATRVQVLAEAADHPILHGVGREEFAVPSWLYKVSPLAAGTTPLVMGRVEGRTPAEPVAWTFIRSDGGRSFYTSLGHPDDLAIGDVRRLVVGGVYWAAGLPVPDELPGGPRPKQGRAARDSPEQLLALADAVAEPPRGGLPAAESAAQLRPADDLAVDLVLSDPLIAQPVQLSFDERGRLWVVEYRQYPHPAGLKMLSRDKFWRAQYDRVPQPPPRHVPGADRITIHEDTDGDGQFDRHLTFVDGLNIATAVAPGDHGVWVLNPPYLLFYPDADGDDRPDGDPEVHLEGFGLEDTHSVVNSLTWGPDG